MGVRAERSLADIALATLVLSHLLITVAHGRAHAGAAVPLGAAATAFVLLIIVIGPVAGLVLRRFAPRKGAWLIAVTMTAAFAFGLINHFIVDGPDHITRIAPSWSALFAGTALLLALTEAGGAGVGIWCAVRRRSP
jgi:hypothetical protein